MPDRGKRQSSVLVVGWGFIGAALGRRLLTTGRRVVGLTRSETGRTKESRRAGAEIVVGDAADPALVRELAGGVDQVVFAAGGLTPRSSSLDPAHETAAFLSPLLSVLEVLRTTPGIPFTLISSGGTVYGEPAELPVAETAPVRPISQYGVTCAAAEMFVQMYSATFGLAAQVLRCANVYGPGQQHDRGQGAVAVFMHRVAHGLPIRITGDGTALRDYVHVDDVARAVESLLGGPGDAGVVNVGSGEGRTVLQVVDAAEHVVGRKAVVEFLPPLPRDVQSIVLDITKLRRLIDYTPTAFEEGVRLTWTHVKPSASRSARMVLNQRAASAG